MKKIKEITPEMKELLKLSGSNDFNVSQAATMQLTKALELPLQQGVLNGDITSGIFEAIRLDPGVAPEFPLDALRTGQERYFVAYTIPNVGRIPEKTVEGDFVMVPTFDVGAAIDWSLKYARDARWDVVARCMEILEGMFVRKSNSDAWHTILASAVSRNLSVYDDAATGGLFTKRLVALMQTVMRRNAGGNSTSVNQGKLTDLFMSPEAHQDVLSWDLTQIPDAIREKIFFNWDANGVTQIGSVRLHAIDELGVGQEFQTYLTDVLGATLQSGKTEFVVGLDLAHNDSFVNPIREDIQIFDDPMLHRQRRAGVYGWRSHGFSALSNLRSLIGNL